MRSRLLEHFGKCASIAILLTFMVGNASAQYVWHDPMAEATPPIANRAWNNELRGSYHRVPDRLRAILTKSVQKLSLQSSGLAVRFRTDSRNIEVRYLLASKSGGHNMSYLNNSGVDLYAADAQGRLHWVGSHMDWQFQKPGNDTITFRYHDLSTGGRDTEYTLYLPNYNEVTHLWVGTDSQSAFTFISPETEKPIVVYGTSIIQGASPSRPGLAITNIIARETGRDVINLGFSGNCFMEPEAFRMLREIDAAVFFVDPIPNSVSLQDRMADDGENLIVCRAVDGVRLLREKSAAPIVLVESHQQSDSLFRRNVSQRYHRADSLLHEAYLRLQAEGVKNLYYISHNELDLTEDGMIEGTHPNDIGSMIYARAYLHVVAAIVDRRQEAR